jgi:hypothetical protein
MQTICIPELKPKSTSNIFLQYNSAVHYKFMPFDQPISYKEPCQIHTKFQREISKLLNENCKQVFMYSS